MPRDRRTLGPRCMREETGGRVSRTGICVLTLKAWRSFRWPLWLWIFLVGVVGFLLRFIFWMVSKIHLWVGISHWTATSPHLSTFSSRQCGIFSFSFSPDGLVSHSSFALVRVCIRHHYLPPFLIYYKISPLVYRLPKFSRLPWPKPGVSRFRSYFLSTVMVLVNELRVVLSPLEPTPCCLR